MASRTTLIRLALVSCVANLVAWLGFALATRVLDRLERRQAIRKRALRVLAEKMDDPLAT